MLWCKSCSEICRQPQYCEGCLCCNICGLVIVENDFADEPSFVKNAAGQSQMAGNFVRTVQSDYSLSRERILKNAYDDMSNMACGLEMDAGESVVRPAIGFYTIALDKNFTKGRRRELVQASCLYIACRENKKPFLLIDFSEYLRVNVYVLGGTFLQLCQLLCLHEHPIVRKPVDPSLFIHRFANRLVGEGYMVVSKTALRIIASMKRDWMQTGRKPSGLCGAALYISALSHGLKFSKSDIVKVVHICEATLTKRLIEFENTGSASLTIEEFEKKAKELDGENNKTRQLSMASKGRGVGELLCEHKGSRKAAFAHGLCESCYNDFIELSGGLDGGSEPPAFQRAERERIAKECTQERADNSHPRQDVERDEQDTDTVGASTPENLQFTGSCIDGASNDQIDEDVSEKGCEDGINDKGEDELDNFSDIDDGEVDSYLHSEEEKHYKKIIWEEMNREYVEEQAAKEAAEAAETASKKAYEARFSICPKKLKAAQELAASAAAAMAKSRKEKQQKRSEEAKNAAPAKTAVEAARQMLTKKRLSSKINYDVLEKLFEEPVVSNNPKKSQNDDEDQLNNNKKNNSKASYRDSELEQDDEYDVDGDGEQAYDENPYYANVEEGYNYDDDYGYEEY